MTRVRGAQLINELQSAWAQDPELAELLDAVGALVRDAVTRLGGVASVGELADEALAVLPPSDDPRAGRLAAGLVRVGLDRLEALARAELTDEEPHPLTPRRRGGRVALLAADPLPLEAAEAVTRRAERLVAEATTSGEAVVSPRRAATELRAAAAKVAPDATALAGDRLLRLAGRVSDRVALGGRGELYDRNLAATTAVALTLTGVAAQLKPRDVRDRVRARFPALSSLPERPRLDKLLAEAGLALVYDEDSQAYRMRGAKPNRPAWRRSRPTSRR